MNLVSHLDVPSVNGYPRYTDAEMARRHGALRTAMGQDIDVIVIGAATGALETSMQYYTNWPPLVESYLIFPLDSEPTVLVRLYNHLPDARRIAAIDDIRYGGDTPDEQAEQVAGILKERGFASGHVGYIGPLRHADMAIFQDALPDAKWSDFNRTYRQLRLVKSEEELRYTRIAADMSDRSVEAMEELIRPGIREFEIAKIVEDAYLAERGTNLIHFTLSTPMADPQVCAPHQYPPDRVIEAGDVIVTEISTIFWGYAGQILRSFTVAAEPTPLYQQLYDVAASTYEDILRILRPGVTVGEILDQTDQITDAGFTIYDDLLHGFGGAYLPPIIRTRESRGATHPDDFAYEAGTVLVIQPNVITRDEKAGVQVGNCVCITEDGAEVLHRYPMKFIRCA